MPAKHSVLDLKKDDEQKQESETRSNAPKLNIRSSDPGKRNFNVQYSWESPERIWKPKSKTWYLTSAVVILSAILFAILSRYPSYPWLVLTLIAFMIMWFVQGTLPPEILQTKITNKGVFTFSTLYRWEDIAFFWIARKEDQYILHLDFHPKLRQPRVSVLINDKDAINVFDHLINHTKYATIQEAQYNIFAKWLYGEYQPISNYVVDLDHPDK